MAATLGFYELLEPYFAFGLAADTPGTTLADLRDANANLTSTFPGSSATLLRIVTELLDYLSVEELLASVDEDAVVYRGSARFGGEGRAAPELPGGQSLTSPGGQELSWQDDLLSFRLTVPRRSPGLEFDTTGLTGPDLADLQQLNELLDGFTDNPAAPVSDIPGADFRLELLLRTVRLVLPPDRFIPARVAADGWLEPDPNFKEVVFEFPRLAFVLEQQGEPGNLDVTLRSWDSAGFDDPGDVDTARFFTLTPPLFLHSSRVVGFGIERLVADFSDNVTPPEILEQFGIGDDFNGFWLPLIRVFIAPGRTTGLALSARGKDLLFDFDKGFSGELALDILNRGGQLEVEPVFYRANAKAPLEWTRGTIERRPDGVTTVSAGAVQIPGDGELHLSIRGSISPYNVVVRLEGDLLTPDTSAGPNRPKWLLPADAAGALSITVTDQGARNSWHETVVVSHVTPPGPKLPPQPEYEILFQEGAGDDGFRIQKDKESKGPNLVLRLTPDVPVPVLKRGTDEIPRKPDGLYRMVLTEGDAPAHFIATWQPPPEPQVAGDLSIKQQQDLVKEEERGVRLYFAFEYPLRPAHLPAEIVDNIVETSKALGKVATHPIEREAGPIDDRANIIGAVESFLDTTDGAIEISGLASNEVDSSFAKNPKLAEKRAETLELLIRKKLPNDSNRSIAPRAYSDVADKDDPDNDSDARFRVAIATAAPKPLDKHRTATAELFKKEPTTVPEPLAEHPPEASEPERPPIFRRIGFRVRFERDQLVLGEVSGQFDFRTQAEEAAGFIQVGDPRNDGASGIAAAVTTPPAANQAGEQGILDYRLTISYDTATRRLTEVLALGFDQQGRDGWVNIGKFEPPTLANTIGSLLVFAPLLNAGIDSAVDAEGNEAIADAVIAGAEVVIATTLGLTGALEFHKLTLFGIELSATELLPDQQAEDQTRFGNLAAMFDYAVDFVVDIDLGVLTIESARDQNLLPMLTRVRYRGLGFRLDFIDANTYQPVFDTSRGFDLGLAEPGALVVGGPLGPLLRVDSLKVARQNPLMLEMDLGLNANLGVVEVESVRVRMPIDPPGIPTIIPTAIGVNIPGAVVGSGYLDIRDNGFAGALDLTLVPLKLRIQASAGLESLEVGERSIVAFFLGLGVEFPAPIPLANSGLGIYGLLGLFGMHYQRDEEPPVNPNLPVSLDWFYNKAKGEPHLIAVEGRRTWVASPDRWSFGVGVVLGTMEGAFILNLKGMLVLELPGPRILIFVKAQIIEPRPPSGKPADQTTGILAVVDLNFQAGYIAIGLIFTYEVKDLVRIEVPIDTQFSFHEIEDWHLHIGSLRNKASADILGIAKGTAYLMFDGKGIPDFPLVPLQGFSIAAGIAASLVIGDESSGLYARVAGSVDMGVTRDPVHFFGRLRLEGRINLWFVGIEASAELRIEAPEPLFVKGEVCGSVDLWLTEIEGCVDITIGDPHPLPDPLPLAVGLSLQSHSPALLEGQATDGPVDASLGVADDAGEVVTGVPLDAIPVLQLRYPPVFSAAATGLRPSSSAPTLPPTGDGWFTLGGVPGQEGEREARYEITNLAISPPLPGGTVDIPVTWWQPARPNAPADSQATDKGVNLALNSWIPVPFPRAYQRSEEQRRTIRDRFEVICEPVAPATAVLWTFNAHFTAQGNELVRRPGDPFPGPSPAGWRLNGAAWPDPPGTHRTTAPSTSLHVHEPDYPNRTDPLLQEYATALTGQVLDPARVIPDREDFETGQALQFPFIQLFSELRDENLAPEVADAAAKFLDEAGNRERIVVETGDIADTRCLICANTERKVTEFMVLRALDSAGGVVEQIKLPGQPVDSIEQLPARWRDPAGPWHEDVRRVFNLLAGEFKGTHTLFLVEYRPEAPIARFELFYEPPEPPTRVFNDPPAVLLGVVETLTRAEVERQTAEEHHQQELVEVVVKSLEEGDKRPLFAPDTLYTVTASFKAQIRKADKPSELKTRTLTQQLRFRTAATAPPRLDPWVLATVPENDAGSHFCEDPVQFIFNDTAAVQLYGAFGKTLTAVLRKANGNHPSDRPTIDGSGLQPVKGLLATPYAVTMGELAAELPCIPGVFETEQHQVFSVDIPLERGTSYLLDIESTPPPEDPLTPLFRTAFTTSRYAGAGELAALVEASFIQERALKNDLTLPVKTVEYVVPDDAAATHVATVQVQTVTDAEMEAALLAATGSDVPPARRPGLTFLWSGSTPSTPVALLVDAPESLLRTRPVPVEVATPSPDGDLVQHFRTGRQLYLEVAESGTGAAERVVYASGGCRLLIFFKQAATGSMRLVLRQHRHTLLTADPPSRDFTLVELDLPAQAPWEA
jgi:large repetitive protein